MLMISLRHSHIPQTILLGLHVRQLQLLQFSMLITCMSSHPNSLVSASRRCCCCGSGSLLCKETIVRCARLCAANPFNSSWQHWSCVAPGLLPPTAQVHTLCRQHTRCCQIAQHLAARRRRRRGCVAAHDPAPADGACRQHRQTVRDGATQRGVPRLQHPAKQSAAVIDLNHELLHVVM